MIEIVQDIHHTFKAKRLLYLFIFFGIICFFSYLISFIFNLSDYAFGHDVRYHYSIIRALDNMWDSGIGFDRIVNLVGQDYGYGTGLFYSLIPAGTAVILMNVFSMSIGNAVSFEIFLLLSSSGIVMFLFMKNITANNRMSLTTALIYVTSPYVLIDIFVRFAFSEMFLILAIPLILWGVYELVNKKNIRKFFLPFTLGYTLAIMTHLTMTVFLTVLILLYLIIYIKDIFKFKLYIPLLISTIVVLLLSATYYVPMFYNMRSVGLDNMSYTSEFLSFNGLWSFVLIWLIPSTLLNIFTIWVFAKNLSDNRGNNSKVKKVLFTFLLLTFIMSTCFFPWFVLPDFVGLIQYSWRMYIVNMPLLAISIGYLIKNDAFKSHKFSLIFGTVICMILSFGVSVNYNFFPDNNEANSINKTLFEQTVNGKSENRGLGANKKGDYLPSRCTTDYIFSRVNDSMVIESDVKITEFANYQSLHQISFIITRNRGESSVIRIPYELIQDVQIYQISDDKNSISYNITTENQDGWLKLNYSSCDSECKITILYEEDSPLDNYLKQNPFEFLIISGEASFTNFIKTSVSNYKVDIDVITTAQIELPTLYYKGYEITLISNDGEEIYITPIHNENGFISINLEDSGTLTVKYVGEYVTIANIVSVIGCVICVIGAGVVFIIPKRFTILESKEIVEN